MTSGNIGVLIDRQVRRWELQHRDATAEPRSPCIAFSRLEGSGGEEIAAQAAEWLDYGFFGTEIVSEIARHRHVREELVADLDEHVRGVIERYLVGASRHEHVTDTEFHQELVRTIATLGHRGMAVILGRGAPFILPPERALRVLVVAPEAIRCERVAHKLGVSEEEAAKALQRADERRHEFIQHHFGVSQDDPLLYDLVVNSGTLSIEAAAGVIIDALRRRFPRLPEARPAV